MQVQFGGARAGLQVNADASKDVSVTKKRFNGGVDLATAINFCVYPQSFLL